MSVTSDIHGGLRSEPQLLARSLTSEKTSAFRGLLIASGYIYLLAAVASVWKLTIFGIAWSDIGPAYASGLFYDAVNTVGVVRGIAVATHVIAFVATLIWLHLSTKDLKRAGVPGMRSGAGWTVLPGLIPVVNLVLPRIMFNQVDRASHALVHDEFEEDWRRTPVLTNGHFWWFGPIVGWALVCTGYYFSDGQLWYVGELTSVAGYAWGIAATVIGLMLVGISMIVGARYIADLWEYIDQPSVSEQSAVVEPDHG